MKSEKRLVVAYKCLPARPPTLVTLIAWLYLDRYQQVTTWVGGVVYAFLAALWIGFFINHGKEDPIEVFEKHG